MTDDEWDELTAPARTREARRAVAYAAVRMANDAARHRRERHERPTQEPPLYTEPPRYTRLAYVQPTAAAQVAEATRTIDILYGSAVFRPSQAARIVGDDSTPRGHAAERVVVDDPTPTLPRLAVVGGRRAIVLTHAED
jgi:hypothetical protein